MTATLPKIAPAMVIFEVLPGVLYQGGEIQPADWEAIIARDIEVVVDLEGHLGREAPRSTPPLLYVRWPIEDGPNVPPAAILDALVAFCAALAAHGRRVLVSCAAGINRSGLLAALIVRHLLGCSGAAALARVRAARPGALVNATFAGYLESLGPPGPRGP